jgi:MFS family permease
MAARGLFAHRDARRYLTGQVLSLLGDSAMWLACGIWVKTLTGSNAAAGLTFLFFTLPTLFAPLGGLLVDRVRRRRLLIACNLTGAAILTPLFLVDDAGDVWIIYAVMLGYGALNVLIEPAQSALLAVLLPDDLRAPANATLRTAQEGLRLVAPLAGAGLFAVLGGLAVVALDIATFLAAAAFTASVAVREPRTHEPIPDRKTFARDLAAGFRHLWGDRILRGVTIGAAVATLVIGFSESAGYAVVEGLHRVPEFLGVLQTVQGVGAIAGGLTATLVIRRLGEVRVTALGVAVYALSPLLCTVPWLPAVMTGRIFSGIGLPWITIAALTLFQRRTPNNLQGRVYTALEVMVSTPQTVSIGVGAALIASFDYRLVLGAEGAVLLVSSLMLAVVARGTASGTASATASGKPSGTANTPGDRPATALATE